MASPTTGSFALQRGYWTYQTTLIPTATTGEFSLSFFPTPIHPHISFSLSGISGKIFDYDGNYIHSYRTNQPLTISGNVFPDYHNIFIDGVPKNLNIGRYTGYTSGFIIDTGVLQYAEIVIQGIASSGIL
tara:strand:- start:493 stop:882 length:390 start_codon:yes stop_codon:yes gene_type:complete